MLNGPVQRPLLFSLLLCLFLRPEIALGWDSITHRLITEESLKTVARDWKLDAAVVVTPFEQFLAKFSRERPGIRTREDFAKWLGIHPQSPFDRPSSGETVGGIETPLEILARYSRRPDDGRDQNLPFEKWNRFWFGGMANIGSQAFRHMEKPAFNPLRPVNTSGFPLGTVGEASSRTQLYFDLALEAKRLGEPYWAWNFLGCSLHYLQDLHQPYHTVQLPAPFAWEGLKAHFDWGRKEKQGLVTTMARLISNAHHYFEGYVAHQQMHRSRAADLWNQALNGREVLENPPPMRGIAKSSRDFANAFAGKTIENTWRLTGNNLKKSVGYRPAPLEQPPQDPIPLLNPDYADRQTAASNISEMVLKNFGHQGKMVRTAVRAFRDASRKGGENAP